jgi:hypothetical protein
VTLCLLTAGPRRAIVPILQVYVNSCVWSERTETEPTSITPTGRKSTDGLPLNLAKGSGTEYQDAMSRSMFLVLPVAAGMLTGCTTLVRSVDWIHAVMTKEEPDEDINNYGAFFTSSLSMSQELPSGWPGREIRRFREVKRCFGRRVPGLGST